MVEGSNYFKVDVLNYDPLDLYPVGAVTPFFMDLDRLPLNWLLCDGQDIFENDYKQLYDLWKISDDPVRFRFGSNGSNDPVGGFSFKVPNLDKYFPRMIDRVAGRDPDKGSRFSQHGSLAGNNIGSYQSSEIKAHKHDLAEVTAPHKHRLRNYLQWPMSVLGGSKDIATVNFSFRSGAGGDHSHYLEGTGQEETLPKFLSCYYIVRYV